MLTNNLISVRTRLLIFKEKESSSLNSDLDFFTLSFLLSQIIGTIKLIKVTQLKMNDKIFNSLFFNSKPFELFNLNFFFDYFHVSY